MPPEPAPPRRNRTIVVIVLLLAVALLALFLLMRCQRVKPAAVAPRAPETTPASAAATAPAVAPPSTSPATVAEPDDVLTPATLQAPTEVGAGAVFSAAWTGPNNPRDFLTLVRKDAPDNASGTYRDTRDGTTLEFTAPMDLGEWELRYVAGRSRRVLGRALLVVTATSATLSAPAEVSMGGSVAVAWTGPNRPGDYITLVPRETPDGNYGNYTNVAEGSPLNVRAPIEPGEGELRYMSGQGAKVLGRRAIRIVAVEVTMSAPATVVAGTTMSVTWTGPNHPGDYITIVPRETPDGNYGNYANTSAGSPLALLVPLTTGEAELRYLAGQGNKLLGRRPIQILAVEITLSAVAEAQAGSTIEITWTGPNYPGDYITIVPRETPEGEYRGYANTSTGSPLRVKVPDTGGDAEIRYVAGQGNKTIARRALRVVP